MTATTTRPPIRGLLLGEVIRVPAYGIEVRLSPLTLTCRLLVAAGADPGAPLQLWAGDRLHAEIAAIGAPGVRWTSA